MRRATAPVRPVIPTTGTRSRPVVCEAVPRVPALAVSPHVQRPIVASRGTDPSFPRNPCLPRFTQPASFCVATAFHTSLPASRQDITSSKSNPVGGADAPQPCPGSAATNLVSIIARLGTSQGASPLEIPAHPLPWSSMNVNPPHARGFKNSELLCHRLAAAGQLSPTHWTAGHHNENKIPVTLRITG